MGLFGQPAGLIERRRPAGQTTKGGGLRAGSNLLVRMPGLWVHLGDNPEFYDTFTLGKGTYVETNLYDNSHEEQGKGLWRIVSSEARKKEGMWTIAKLLAVSDAHLHWWVAEGPGKEAAREFNLHFCTNVEKDCTKTKRKPSHEFHTDYFRLLDASDLTASKVAWFRQPPAAEDIDLEVAKLTGGTPRGRDRRGVKKGSAPSGHLDWEIPDADEMPDLEGLDGEAVNQRLAKLKRQTVGEPEQQGKEKDTRKRSRSRKKRRKGTSSSGDDKKKDAPLWFGKRRSPSPRRRKRRRSKSESPKKGGSDKPKKKRSRSTSGSRRDRKKRRESHADRGPYGVGQKLRYDGKDTSSLSSGDKDDEREEVFRAGPSGTSKHLQLQEYAAKKPGRLTARLLQKMKDVLARGEGPGQIGQDLTPASATSYFLTVIVPTYKEHLSLRTSRELRSIAKALDLLAQGHGDRAGDVLSQRYKALELSLTDQTWARAQFLELIPPEGASLVEKDEMLMASKEQTTEQKMRNQLTGNLWRPPQKGDGRTDEKGKSKGKGRDKKGRGPPQSWQAAGDQDKPPAS